MSTDMSHPSLLFQPISPEQRERIESIRALSGNTLHVHAFASLFAWQASEQYGIYVSDDAFLVKYGARGEDAYLFPCGAEPAKKELIDALLREGKPVFYFVSDEDKCFLERVFPGRFTFSECRNDYPYLYDRNEQIAMVGKDYKNLRHQVNIGRESALHWSSERLDATNLERALAINREWSEARPREDLADTAAAETALRNFADLRLWGMLFTADGKDISYVAGTFITPEKFDICFCKVLDKRCDCFIKWELYRALPAEVSTVDSEEDMGLEGLRTHKLLRRPKELVRVWKGKSL